MCLNIDLLIWLLCITLVKPVAKISLFCSDKNSIIIVKYFEIYEARVGVGVKTSDSEQDWLSPVIQVIISILP
jgi:hypothetical protein